MLLNITNKVQIIREANESILSTRECTLRYAHAGVMCTECNRINARALLSRILNIVNSDWLQHARSVRGMYEC